MKRKRRLVWQIYPPYLLITLVALALVTWYATGALRQFFLRQTARDLEARAYLLQEQIASLLSSLETDVVDAICKESGRLSAMRITVVLPDGRVIGDSKDNPQFMDNHGGREEVLTALKGTVGQSIRFSRTLQHRMMYVAVPLVKNNHVQAVIRTAISVATLDEALASIQLKITIGGLLVALLAAGVGLYVSRRIAGTIDRIRMGAEQFAKGDLNHRLPAADTEEMTALADALNRMAAQLDDRMKAVSRQRSELAAVLASMAEGVVAVDGRERIISMNHAAGRMFGWDPARAHGRNIQEVIRDPALQRIVLQALAGAAAIAEDVVLYRGGERVLNLHGSTLVDADNQAVGSVLVFNDVTRLRHLENVRSDFVANVSHEIKTPLTAIKGFVETLQQGSLEKREERERFLGIIIKHVDRLNAIVEDLLTLARIEQEGNSQGIRREIRPIDPIVRTAVQVCQPKAAGRNVTIDSVGEPDLAADIDATLLEQALVNLIDNAVKYSHPGGTVSIRVERQADQVRIAVADRGTGIARKHLDRLFERFYRVDQARSRQLGGTGLGLSIVKHIVQAQGGHVTVDSELGKGSTFVIHLPVRS